MPNESPTADQVVLTHLPSLPLDRHVPALSDQASGQGTIATASITTATLDLTQFTTVWDHNFATNHSASPELTRTWGTVKFNRLDATEPSYARSGWGHDGMMQPPTGATAGNGYGLYQATASIESGDGPGAFLCLWPATNVWPGPEIDLIEKSSTSNTSGYSTVHWADPTNPAQDDYAVTMLPQIDVSQKHTYAVDWEKDHLSFYVDNNLLYTTTSHVPLDAADGGQNECFGAGMQPYGTQSRLGSNVLHIDDMSYSAHV